MVWRFFHPAERRTVKKTVVEQGERLPGRAVGHAGLRQEEYALCTADYDTWTAIYLAYLALLAGDVLPAAVSFFPAGANAALSAGDRGASVLALSLMLGTAMPHFADAAPVPLTGEYDADTVAGVRRAQGLFLLPQTGVTDRATWEALALLHNGFFGRTPLTWLDQMP